MSDRSGPAADPSLEQSGLRWWADVYRAFIRLELAVKAQYRVHTVIWLISLLAEPVVYLAVWSSVAAAQGGSVGGYRAADFAAYYLVLLVVRQATVAPSPYRVAGRIQRGEMSAMLLRPIHPVHGDLAEVNTQKLSSVVVLLPLALIVGALFGAHLAPSPWSVIAFLPALLLAGLVRFFVQYALATVGFWTTKVDGIWWTYVTLQTFLGGILAPLPLLPPALRVAATVLPFRWIFTFPVDLMLGRVSLADAAIGFAVQIAWILGAILALRFLWRAGVRQYSAVGG